jgi:nondiscriminating glutamyl-tRNA synthetase
LNRRSEKSRVRFAPSPTGDLHVGNARTALYNWLFARHTGGAFVLRVEDTDRDRNSAVFERNILDDLKWLNLAWDEGPDRGGPLGPYRQSERLDLYGDHLERLREKNLIYPCFCTEEELEAERASLIARGMMPRYTGKCRELDAKTRARLESEGRKPASRFKVGRGVVEFTDLIRGPMRFDSGSIGDFIVVRSTGVPAYNFAAVVDDHLMAITHVIRGEDHLSNTALQIMLYRSFGYDPPEFAHHGLILAGDRTKLSKRHGAVTVREFQARGFLPEALFNFLALLGSFYGEGREILSPDELIERFSLDRVGKGGAVFDEEKLAWVNRHYIHHAGADRLVALLDPFAKSRGYDTGRMDGSWLATVVDAAKHNAASIEEIADYLDVFTDGKYTMSPEAAAILATEESKEVLKALADTLGGTGEKDEADFQAVMTAVKKVTGLSGKRLFMPVRAALTGRMSGPELDRVFAILGRKSMLRRLQQADNLP